MKITKLGVTFEKIVWNRVNRRARLEPLLRCIAVRWNTAMEPAGRAPVGWPRGLSF
jgi:hypothetical protein